MQCSAAGAEVTALDRSAKRLRRLEANLTRTGLRAEIVCADLHAYEPAALFDLVVLDAPCSATGTLRRNPDILWHRDEQAIREVVTIQQALLARAARWVKPGGWLLYLTCSLFHDEGEGQSERFLQAHPSYWQRAAIDWQAGGVPLAPAIPGTYRTHPALLAEQGGMDGFFADMLQRNDDA
jgi:16S rRNA (cytosine967-C5)-methyltransferase